MVKQCSVCKEEKSVSEFYRDRRSASGRYSACKKCHHKYTVGSSAGYGSGYKYERHMEWQRRYRQDRQRFKAHTIVTNHVHRGLLQKEPCRECGSSKVDAHHDDYSKPLEIIWLCRLHHKRLHNKLKDQL